MSSSAAAERSIVQYQSGNFPAPLPLSMGAHRRSAWSMSKLR